MDLVLLDLRPSHSDVTVGSVKTNGGLCTDDLITTYYYYQVVVLKKFLDRNKDADRVAPRAKIFLIL